MSYDIVEVDSLIPHEEINIQNLEKVKREIQEKNVVEKSIIIDKHSNTILDGHHRYTILKELKFKYIPVIKIDYLRDETIKLEFFREEFTNLDKISIIENSLNGIKLPHKTTKHIHNIDTTCNISLEELK